MRVAGGKDWAVWEWLAMGGFVAGAFVLAGSMGLNRKWEDALVYTVVIFAVVTLGLRSAWSRPGFWRNLLLLLVLHAIGMVILTQSLPPKGRLSWLTWFAIVLAEVLLIAGVLWKRAVRSKQGRFGIY